MNELNLDNLSNKEIQDLWAKTTTEAKRQHGAKLEAQLQSSDIANDDYYIDNFGNAIEGKPPAPKSGGEYCDERGYMQTLEPGEKPPLPTNNLKGWLNTIDIVNDSEVREALSAEDLYFETKLNGTDLYLLGRLENTGWRISAKTEEGTAFKFRLSRSLSKEEAITQAENYSKSKLGPVFNTLTPDQLRMAERMSVGNRILAFAFYLQARLPAQLAEKFLSLGRQAEITGNDLPIHHFAADEKISEIAEEAGIRTFVWSNPEIGDDFLDFVNSNSNGRLLTFALLDSLWDRYKTGSATREPEPTRAEVMEMAEGMSDQELAATIAEARKLQRQSR